MLQAVSRLLKVVIFGLFVTRRELMSAVDEIKAAIAAERTEVQAKLKELADTIDSMDAITPEQKAELIAEIQNISEPEAPSEPVEQF